MSTEATAWGDCPNCSHGIRPGDFIKEAENDWWAWEHDRCADNERDAAHEELRAQLVEAWERGWRAGYESPDLPCEPGEHVDPGYANPYRIEGVDK